MTACATGDVELLDRLIKIGVDPCAENNGALFAAVHNGHAECVKRLMLDTRVDAAHYDSFLIRVAASKGGVEVVDALLQDQRVDPSIDDNEPIRLAAKYCRFSVVLRLLDDPRVNPTARNNEVILWALCRFDLVLQTEDFLGPSLRCVAVIDRLLCDARVLATISDEVYERLSYIGMVRSRFSLVCIGLQDLDLPALVTLEILDALIPNNVRMAAKWDLVVAVKHWRDRTR